MISCTQLFSTHGQHPHEAPPSMEFSRQEYWSGVSFPTPRDLPEPGTEPVSLVSPALVDVFFTPSATWEALHYECICVHGVSHAVVSDSATPWTVAHQASLSMEFSKQEYCSGLSFPSPGDFSSPRIKLLGLLH